jgi:hypothetical protein
MAAMCLVLAAPAHGQAKRCDIAQKQICERGAARRAVPAKAWSKIDLKAARYSRCDRLGCDDYPAVVRSAGVWTTLSLPDHGMLARVGRQAEFVEIVTLGDSVYLSYGKCRR